MKTLLIWANAFLAFILVLLNTLILCIGLYIFALLKAVPFVAWQNYCHRILTWICESWVLNNNRLLDVFFPLKWSIQGVGRLSKKETYFVISNHYSWVDILVLQRILAGRVAFPVFFIKKELFWVPILGMAWWALEFPFMKRYTKKQLAKNPKLAEADLITTQKACQRLSNRPSTLINFLEGTRFSNQKKNDQGSPFENLLKPKAGGAALVFSHMGRNIDFILDFTIAYDKSCPTLVDLFLNRISRVDVHVSYLQVPSVFFDRDYLQDASYKADVADYLNTLWDEKDKRLKDLIHHKCMTQ
jgi:1-acyl-sn-glycerol-3-phosphate acyltransferase